MTIWMPHYSDGTEAKVGDQVIGQLYNTTGVRAGTIISITPGAESCNAMVAFIEAVPIDPAPSFEQIEAKAPRMAVRDPSTDPGYSTPALRRRIVRGEAHGSAGATFALFECADFCAVRELTKVS